MPLLLPSNCSATRNISSERSTPTHFSKSNVSFAALYHKQQTNKQTARCFPSLSLLFFHGVYQIAVPGPVPKSSMDRGLKSDMRLAISFMTFVTAA